METENTKSTVPIEWILKDFSLVESEENAPQNKEEKIHYSLGFKITLEKETSFINAFIYMSAHHGHNPDDNRICFVQTKSVFHVKNFDNALTSNGENILGGFAADILLVAVNTTRGVLFMKGSTMALSLVFPTMSENDILKIIEDQKD